MTGKNLKCQCQRTDSPSGCLLDADAEDLLCDRCRKYCRKPQIWRKSGK